MNVQLRYLGRSRLKQIGSGSRILQMAPNLARDEVSLDAPLIEPTRFREAISALHDVVINDMRFEPRDKTAYEEWKKGQANREQAIRRQAREAKKKDIEKRKGIKPSEKLELEYNTSLKKYWNSRRALNSRLQRENPTLWRKLMPYDPVITVADDVAFFECFSADESSYGCLTVDRHECFGNTALAKTGTTNVDYSWDLYDNFQSLRSYRETRFCIDPDGFGVQTEGHDDYREEKIELPDGWLRGFMQLQSAMCLPMRKIPLSVSSLYSLLAFLKRNKARTSPRAIRFELSDGHSPRMVLEPWEKTIESPETKYAGPTDEPIRVWGRRRLMTLGRLLPLATGVDVYVLGTGLPTFWIVKMGNMRFTLGLSGWSANDWTRGSAVEMLLPPSQTNDVMVAKVGDSLSQSRQASLNEISLNSGASIGSTAAALNQLALRGQTIFDLDASEYRWRQIMPMALSDKELGPPHPEILGAKQLLAARKYKIDNSQVSPRGGFIVSGDVGGKPCEALINGDGVVKRGKCLCGWHFKFGIRNGPCRHIQVLRDSVWQGDATQVKEGDASKWYEKMLSWKG